MDSAYRRMPVRPADQAHIVVHWDSLFWIDHCVPFGAASSNGIFARCGDAIARIYKQHGIGPVFKWVDDFLFFRLPSSPTDTVFTTSEANIMEIAAYLGWPWKASKTRPFTHTFVYLGFEWDIITRQVSIPTTKREKYRARIRELCNGQRVPLTVMS